MNSFATGRCLCGGVRYRVRRPLRPVVACHCQMCRRMSGHYFAATQAYADNLTFESDQSLRWYESSPGVHRGFCAVCGSSLFFDRQGTDRITITAGTLDAPTGLRLAHHIFTAHAGDYYEIQDGLPQSPEHGDIPGIPDHD